MKLVQKIIDEWDSEKVLIGEYAASLHMWIGTLKHLGAAIAIAFKDTKSKANEMLFN